MWKGDVWSRKLDSVVGGWRHVDMLKSWIIECRLLKKVEVSPWPSEGGAPYCMVAVIYPVVASRWCML